MKLNRRFTVAALPAAMVLLSSQVLAQGMSGMGGPGWMPSPYEGMYGSMGNVYSPYYRQFHAPGMAGMTGMAAPVQGAAQGAGQASAPPTPGMPSPGFWPGPAAYPAPMPGVGAPGAAPYPSPYEGMYGSMGNTYSPYYRQFHNPGMAGASGTRPGSGM